MAKQTAIKIVQFYLQVIPVKYISTHKGKENRHMKIYIPYFHYGRKVMEVETSKAIYIHNCGYNANVIYYGTIFNGDHLFKTLKAAKEYNFNNVCNAKEIVNASSCVWCRYKECF